MVSQALPLELKTYKVGMEGYDFSPHYYSVDGKKAGFEIDLLNAIFARMGRSHIIVDQYQDAGFSLQSDLPKSGPIDFADILKILSVKSNHGKSFALDMVTSALSITADRKKVVDFSDSIISSTEFFIGKTDSMSITEIPMSLNGLKVGVEKNSMQENYLKYLQQTFPKFEIVSIEKSNETSAIQMVFNNLVEGKVDIIIVCDDLFQMRFEKDPQIYKGLGKVSGALNKAFGGEKLGSGNGFIFRKNDPVSKSLRLKINKTLKGLIADCSYSEIFYKYFNYDNKVIPEHCKK